MVHAKNVGRFLPSHFVFAVANRVERCLLCSNSVYPMSYVLNHELHELHELRNVIKDLQSLQKHQVHEPCMNQVRPRKTRRLALKPVPSPVA